MWHCRRIYVTMLLQSNPTFHRLAHVSYGSENIFWIKFHCRWIRYEKPFVVFLNRNVWKYFHLSLIWSPIVHFNFNNNDSYFFFIIQYTIHSPFCHLICDIFIYPRMNDKWLICVSSVISYTVCSTDTTKLLMSHYSFDLYCKKRACHFS